MNARDLPFLLARLWFAALLGLTGQGCAGPKVLDCRIPCVDPTGCPQNFACSNGFCAQHTVCSPADGDAGGDAAEEAMADASDLAAADTNDDADAAADQTSDRGPRDGDAGSRDGAADGDAATETGPRSLSDIAGLVLWLDAADLTPGGLSVWPDKSPLGNFGSAQPDGSARVVIDSHAQLPVVDLAGPSDYVSVRGSFSDFTAGMAMFVVLYPRLSYVPLGEADMSTNIVNLGVVGSNSNNIMLQRVGRGEAQLQLRTFLNGENSSTIGSPEAVGNYSWQIFETIVDGGKPGFFVPGKLFRNGVQLVAATIGVPNLVNRNSNLIGAANDRTNGSDVSGHYLGRIAEIIVYSRKLSDDERIVLERYLSSKWHIALGR